MIEFNIKPERYESIDEQRWFSLASAAIRGESGRLENEFPNLRTFRFTGEVILYNSRTIPNTKFRGYCDQEFGKWIKIACPIALEIIRTPKLGSLRKFVDDSLLGVWRHEYGHFVYLRLPDSLKDRWYKIYKNVLLQNAKKLVSFYASVNRVEAFCECFCAKTALEKLSIESSIDEFFSGII